MAALECPRCSTQVPVGMGWAQAALSTLIAAPAVRDLATQVRCPNCGYLFAESDVRHLRAGAARTTRLALPVAALAIVAWAIWEFSRM